MGDLAKEHPQEYPKGTPSIDDSEAAELAREVKEWNVGGRSLKRKFGFKDFKEAYSFVTRVALLAEAESHHPDISISYNEVELEFWTHTADGLTRNDFIMAAKIDAW